MNPPAPNWRKVKEARERRWKACRKVTGSIDASFSEGLKEVGVRRKMSRRVAWIVGEFCHDIGITSDSFNMATVDKAVSTGAKTAEMSLDLFKTLQVKYCITDNLKTDTAIITAKGGEDQEIILEVSDRTITIAGDTIDRDDLTSHQTYVAAVECAAIYRR